MSFLARRVIYRAAARYLVSTPYHFLSSSIDRPAGLPSFPPLKIPFAPYSQLHQSLSNPSRMPRPKRNASTQAVTINPDPDENPEIVDGKSALRASPDARDRHEEVANGHLLDKGTRRGRKRKVEVNDLDSFDEEPSDVATQAQGTSGRKRRVKTEDGDESYNPNGGTKPAGGTTPKKKTPTKASVAARKGADEIKAFVAAQKAAKSLADSMDSDLSSLDDSPTKKTPIKRPVRARPVKKEAGEKNAPGNGAIDDPDPEAAGEIVEDSDKVKEEARRPPPVNSDYLPLPWKGRLGYACLNTYLRLSVPPVFSSRTCRIASILEHRHPLADPSIPEHATKNRPDRTKPASLERGMKYVQEIGLANAKDITKMIQWNERFGIRFLRLSSEMFPFASHPEYGYNLDFAADVLAEAGKWAAKYNHRLTTHPGQFTQLGSPRKAVIDNTFRDLTYHSQLLSSLRLPGQLDRDAVMILHMGGIFGDKAATLDRFRENYSKLAPAVQRRVVLENDDVAWSVHELLPVCEELDIPLVLDWHHHNIIHSDEVREGTKDILELMPRILKTWEKRRITPKMHYSEPTAPAITGRQRRKHSDRVKTLPPCPDTMDLMIEAKDKEQAVFELMRTFRLPGFDLFNDIVPYERDDDHRLPPGTRKTGASAKKKTSQAKSNTKSPKGGKTKTNGKAQGTPKARGKTSKTSGQAAQNGEDDDDEDAEDDGQQVTDDGDDDQGEQDDGGASDTPAAKISDEDFGMGGKDRRVYWPSGMEEWLRPKKREVKAKKQNDAGAEQDGEEE